MKKFSVLLLISILLLNFTVYAEKTQDNLTEPEIPDNYAVSELVKLGILDGSLILESAAQRNEIARIISKTLRLPETGIPLVFSDVDETTANSGYISTMQMNGIMIGNNEKMFLPEKDITSDELIKTIVATLGYSPYANEKGGYPKGYLEVAKEIGLIGEDYITENSVSIKDTSKLIYKSLSIPLMKQTVFGPEPEYVIFNGTDAELDTILSCYWGLK